VKEIIQLAQDLSIDDVRLRDMIYESCTRIGVSPSWLRKMLPKNLKLSKHTRKDYLKRQQQRDQQTLQQQQQTQQQQRELVELPISSSSLHPALEQRQQPSDNEEKTATTTTTTKVTTYDDDNHSIAVIPLITQKENEGLVEES
jgi:hypothetical protein